MTDPSIPRTIPDRPLESLRHCVRRRGLAPRTERIYLAWARRWLDFRRDRGWEVQAPWDDDQAVAFSTYLTDELELSPSSRNQALSALRFFARHVLGRELDGLEALRSTPEPSLPTVLDREEIREVLRRMPERARLVPALLYGTGAELSEGLQARVKDLVFDGGALDSGRWIVRRGDGTPARVARLPGALVPALRVQSARAVESLERRRRDRPGVELPRSVARRDPGAAWDPAWQYLFPDRLGAGSLGVGSLGVGSLGVGSLGAGSLGVGAPSKPLSEKVVQRAFRAALEESGVGKRAGCHTLRHSFAVHRLEEGWDPGFLREVLGHRSIRTVEIYVRLARPLRGDEIDPLEGLFVSDGSAAAAGGA